MTEYKLLNGESVSLAALSKDERALIERLSVEAKEGRDYFSLLRSVKGPNALPLRGGRITPEVAASVLYRVAHDIVDRAGIAQGYVLDPSLDVAKIKGEPGLLSLTEAAELIGVTRAAAHQAVQEARLAATRIGNAWVLRRADAEAFRDARARG